ncbi:MAG: tRNA lysidine(34) synthetase TilS [Chloroflexi bacterium]|nr:tRNA lysidine(34) synthetase TilS [Chloroflexota bacterium]
MHNRFIAYHLPTDELAVIGVSGGPDSLCLLHLARRIPNLDIIVAHFDHQLRPEANLEAEFVRSVAEQMKLPFVTESADVRGYAEEHKLSLEESARTLRYRFLFAQARAHRAGVVAVGHTADDQVETILMHFLRGAGLAGLKGMAGCTFLTEFDREIPLVRPILHLWRHETEAYCREHNLQPVHDPSNTDETYFRNRLRHSLIPDLEKYNPRFKNTLLRTAEALAGDYETLTDAVDSVWPKVVLKADADYVAFRSSVMEEIPRGLRRNIFRRAMEFLRPNMRNLDFNTLERASNFVDARTRALMPDLVPRQVDLTDGLYLYREGDAIYLAALEADLPSAHWPLMEGVYELQINGQVNLNENFFLSAFEVDVETASQFAHENGDSFVAWLDADLTGDRFTIRTRRAGDVISPLGMNRQTVKLREFFINVKLPRRARAGWPLVCAGEQIVWVPGFRLAHPFRVTEKTKRVLKLILQPS